MTHHLQHIVDLVEICRLKGIRQVVVSPGSRNAPLIELFHSCNNFYLHSIIDERSAGYYALGIALATQKPVALLCTSGTAVLNYSPALAEAYYQRIPLIAITADRPEDLIDQQDNQTIRQKDVFQNFVKGSLHLNRPDMANYNQDKQNQTINDIINLACTGINGPVHINVPIAEPLYVEMPKPCPFLPITPVTGKEKTIPKKFLKSWNQNPGRIIICGAMMPDAELNNVLNTIANEQKAVVMAEPLSNIRGEKIISEIDRLMAQIETESADFKPGLLISLGGPVVSKRIKTWLQKQKDISHFRISEEDDKIDTYQNLAGIVQGKASNILKQLSEFKTHAEEYSDNWLKAYTRNHENHRKALTPLPFSDIRVFEKIIDSVPDDFILHLGNSTPVRYALLFDLKKFSRVCSNRGVSGIDGCLSTAAGFASQSDKTNLVILGDLSFIYDSNALWNKKLPENLKIVVINNNGGGIFRLIPGPSTLEAFEEFIETRHTVDIEKLAAAFNVDYLISENENELETTINRFLKKTNNPVLLEIKTPDLKNAKAYKSSNPVNPDSDK